MKSQYLFCMAVLFLILQINFLNRRYKPCPDRDGGLNQIPFFFPALLLLGGSVFQALIAHTFLNHWEISALCSFYLFIILILQVHTFRTRGSLLLKSRSSQYLQKFFLLAGMAYLLFRIKYIHALKPASIDDSTLTTLILGILFILIGSAKLSFRQNGIQLGFVFVAWERIRSWDWNPHKPSYLAVSTDSWLFPKLILVFNEQRKLVENILWERSINAKRVDNKTDENSL